MDRRTEHVVDDHLRVALASSRREPSVSDLYVDLSEVSVDPEALAELLAAFAPAERKDGLTDLRDLTVSRSDR